jgi:hypothetical protein
MEKLWKEAVLAYLKCCPGILLDRRFPDQGSNQTLDINHTFSCVYDYITMYTGLMSRDK